MQIHQILVRPDQNRVTVVYVDSAGRRNTLAFDSTNIAAVQTVIADCQARLPADTDHPDKAEIQQEIQSLEARVAQLKESIGQP